MEKYVYDVQTGKGGVVPMSDEEIKQQLELEKLSKANAAKAEPTLEEKLGSVGLSVADLKTALGL
jgi:hypothetical protein